MTELGFEHLMADVKRLTACRTKCPECGHVGMASWCNVEDVCKCRKCGVKFHFKANTYRPLTEGMTEIERKRFYKRNIPRIADLPPEERERQRELARERQRRYLKRKKAGLVGNR